jgi:hypothetical protein
MHDNTDGDDWRKQGRYHYLKRTIVFQELKATKVFSLPATSLIERAGPRFCCGGTGSRDRASQSPGA